MSSCVTDYIKQEVPDWDDEITTRARFKAFSGQRSDWEPQFQFWRGLIIKVSRHLGVFIIQASEVKNWFTQGGLTPLCIDSVLLEMYSRRDIIQSANLVDHASGTFSQILQKIVHVMRLSNSPSPEEILEDHLILKILLEEKATEVVKLLSDGQWTSSCVVTIKKFEKICKGSKEASVILSYLSTHGKARCLSFRKNNLIEGLKISLVSEPVRNISSLDCDILHMVWTLEKLQQQLDLIDQRSEKSKRLALASLKLGNKPAALGHARQLKMITESRSKCMSLLNRVEDVLAVITDAESTKNVYEAIQIGTRIIKDNKISVEEVESCLKELDDIIALQKQAEAAIEPRAVTDIEKEDIEDEFRKLELELGKEVTQVLSKTSQEDAVTATTSRKKAEIQETSDSLIQKLSNLHLESA